MGNLLINPLVSTLHNTTTNATTTMNCIQSIEHIAVFSKKRINPVSALPRRVRFRTESSFIASTVPEILEPTTAQDAWFKQKDIVEQQEQTVSKATFAAYINSVYPKAASTLYKACSLVRDENDIHQLDCLAVALALADKRDELRGIEFDISSSRVQMERIQRSQKRTQLIVSMYKELSSRMTTEERDEKLQTLSESISKPARLMARVMGTSDAVAALVEHGR